VRYSCEAGEQIVFRLPFVMSSKNPEGQEGMTGRTYRNVKWHKGDQAAM